MAKSPPYRLFLGGLLLTGLAAWSAVRLAQERRKPDCLYSTALDLSGHAISQIPADSPRPIVFFGSSAMAGTDLFPHLTFEGYFDKHLRGERSYNLAAPGLNVLDILAYFRLSLAYRPRLAVVGLLPDDFVFSPTLSTIVLERPNLVQKELPARVFAKIAPFCGPLSRLAESFRQPVYPSVSPAELALLHGLYRARQRFYSNPRLVPGFGSFDAFGTVDPYWRFFPSPPVRLFSDVDDLLGAFKRLAIEHDVALVVLLPPMSTFQRNLHPWFAPLLKEALARARIRTLDYSGLLATDPDAFVDDSHYNPRGCRRLAQRLYRDLSATPGDISAR